MCFIYLIQFYNFFSSFTEEKKSIVAGLMLVDWIEFVIFSVSQSSLLPALCLVRMFFLDLIEL